MKFDTYLPCDLLKPYVRSFAIQETAEAYTYKVLPDTGLVIGFQYRGRLSRIENDHEMQLSVSGISGLADRSNVFRNTPGIGTVLVFFREAGATPFFKQPLQELFRESVSLDNFMLRSELACLEEQLAEAKSDVKRIALVERFLVGRLKYTEPDKLVLAALALIHQRKGNIRIRELTEQLNISQSPLEKRFRQAVGASPKKFASIVRLKNVIEHHDPSLAWTDISFEAGFYDQAHFIKEFKNFTGDTPEKFFSDR